ncbi:hypothetical protein ACFU6I_02875 [Streptomyces sp. NPDC057486]|uniref:hypothetical protein n=1 Tax=Streptomyces sp. NPDC057486 TaxID=3346145 RepID=UPI0036973A86
MLTGSGLLDRAKSWVGTGAYRSVSGARIAPDAANFPASLSGRCTSAVAGLFTGVLADRVHGRIDACPARAAGRVRRALLAGHATAASR